MIWKSLTTFGSLMAATAELKVAFALVDEGKIRPVIDSVYPLEDYRLVLETMEAGKKIGKIVIMRVACRMEQKRRTGSGRRVFLILFRTLVIPIGFGAEMMMSPLAQECDWSRAQEEILQTIHIPGGALILLWFALAYVVLFAASFVVRNPFGLLLTFAAILATSFAMRSGARGWNQLGLIVLPALQTVLATVCLFVCYVFSRLLAPRREKAGEALKTE